MEKFVYKVAFFLLLIGVNLPIAVAGAYGLEAMADFSALPVCSDEGDSLVHVSSHDRDGGNGKDGFDGTYSSLYQDEDGDYILFDDIGAGCISRIWMTFSESKLNPTNHIRFYFDDEKVPRVDVSLIDFFSGEVDPFLSPLVGNNLVSSGGYYSYLPFPYSQRCRIEMSVQPYFYHITSRRMNVVEPVKTWTGFEDSSAVRTMWGQCGKDPEVMSKDDWVVGDIYIPAGQTGSVFSVQGEGALSGFFVDLEPCSLDVLTNTWIQMYWDGVTEPQVSAPLGEFFGSGFGETDVSALPIGMRVDDFYYCWFPMPFWKSARIEIVNHSSVAISNLSYEVRSDDRSYDKRKSGWFYATSTRRTINQSDGNDFVLLDVAGQGKVVGVVLSIKNRSKDPLGYLEGDERIYVDGSSSPVIYGTGTEDFFNGGWYFNKGPFSLPLHGHPMRKHEWHDKWWVAPYITNNFTTAYRFLLEDAIPFRSSVRFGMEHGYNNSQFGDYSSVVYYYKLPNRLGAELRAELNVGAVESEALLDYSVGSNILVTNSWFYEGDSDGQLVADVGRQCSDFSQFSVAISPRNAGLFLRRRIDSGAGTQRLNVFVDDVKVGVWYFSDNNFSLLNKRWVENEFFIPAEFTAGKSSVTFRFECDLVDGALWNEYRYWVYELNPFILTDDRDEDGLSDEWEVLYYNSLLEAVPEGDDDHDHMDNLKEYISGTNPLDGGSFFNLKHDNGVFSFSTQRDRIYGIWYSTNLVEDSWTLVSSNVLGNTGMTTNWGNGVFESGFYRVDVALP